MSAEVSREKPGEFAGKFLKSLAIGGGDLVTALAYADAQGAAWADHRTIKAAVEAVGLHGADNSSLTRRPGDSFLALAWPQTAIARLPHLRRTMFDVGAVRQTTAAPAYWTGEGAPSPLAVPGFVKVRPLPVRKVVSISVITTELLRAGWSENLILTGLASATVAAIDSAFADPSNAGDSAKPASIAHGATVAPSAGGVAERVAAAISEFRGDLMTAAWIMHPRMAVKAAQGVPGAGEHLGALGGTLHGLPVVVSASAARDSIVLFDQAAVEIAGAEEAELSTTKNASVLMSDTPESPGTLTSLFQSNCVGLKATIPVNWRVSAPEGSVVLITGV